MGPLIADFRRGKSTDTLSRSRPVFAGFSGRFFSWFSLAEGLFEGLLRMQLLSLKAGFHAAWR